ncbi:MAG TPA: M48 family metallopeptidase [Gammaproteobacteria bacterium]|nr:M48 family metallopeptidase [Gammaproteobacteria bacterium]
MRRLCMFLVVAVAALYLINAAAAPQNTSKPDANPATASVAAHFDADAATQAWLDTLSPAARAKSDAYFEGGYWLILWDFLVGLLVAWLLLGNGLSTRLRDFNERLVRFKWLQTAFYAIEYIVFTTVVTLPWTLYEGYFREHQYGMSNQDLGAFIGDQAKGLILSLILGTVAFVVIYAVVRKTPRTWWIWGALVGILFIVFSIAIGPTYLEPVFNKFYPLADGPLKQQILSMARANGIPATDVFEFDASKQTKRMSAHVSGLFGTTQISLNDNLINRGSPEEVKAVLGHEMGHYVLHHVFHGIVEFSVLIILGFAFLKWSFEKLRTGWGAGWGIRDVGDPAGLPLLVVLFSVYLFVLTPVTNTLTRTQEAEADIFGLNASRQPDGFAQAAIHLSEYRKMEPGTLEEVFFYDHPSGYHRIHRAMVWKAEHLNDPDILAYDAAHPKIEMPPEPGQKKPVKLLR